MSNQIEKYIQSHMRGSFRIDHSAIKCASIAGMLYLVSQASRLVSKGNYKRRIRISNEYPAPQF